MRRVSKPRTCEARCLTYMVGRIRKRLLQTIPARFSARVASLHPSQRSRAASRQAEALTEAADLPHGRAQDQVPQLRAAQWSASLRMIRVHERIPPPARRRAAANRLQLDAAQ